jgi:hypothetical protein
MGYMFCKKTYLHLMFVIIFALFVSGYLLQESQVVNDTLYRRPSIITFIMWSIGCAVSIVLFFQLPRCQYNIDRL